MKQKKLRGKKAAFLKAWIKTFGNITQSCNAIGINRGTYYNWLREDENFKIAIENEEVGEQQLDFAESKLMKNIHDGKETSLIFFLKTKGKERGYVERTETKELSPTQIVFNEMPFKKE